MKKVKITIFSLAAVVVSVVFTGFTDYCSYGGCMREATEDNRCSEHYGLQNNPYYGVPEEWLD